MFNRAPAPDQGEGKTRLVGDVAFAEAVEVEAVGGGADRRDRAERHGNRRVGAFVADMDAGEYAGRGIAYALF